MKKTTYLTKQGLSEMQDELDLLINSRRPELAQRFKEARTSGNPSENGECNYIRAEQSLVENRIVELRALLKDAQVVKDVDTTHVSVGTKVKLESLASHSVKIYSIVSTHEANPLENKISNESPIARAILGKTVSDIATVVRNGLGVFQVRILGITT
jgi:transcription elongation factor GreA